MHADVEQLVLKNRRLVHYLVQKLGFIDYSKPEYDDLVSVGTIGLIKAANSYDASKNIKFATYASRCIKNEIFMHFRKTNKYADEVSLDAPLFTDFDGNELTLGDTIEHEKSNFVEEMINEEEFINLVNIVLNHLRSRDRIIMLYRMADVGQEEIGKRLNFSQSYVSRLETKSIKKIKEAFKLSTYYKEVFSMSIQGETYKITFASKDVGNFKEQFASFLQSLTSTENLSEFRVSCNKERIAIHLPANLESFKLVADLMQHFEDFSVSYAIDRNTVSENNKDMLKNDSKEESESNVNEGIDTDIDTEVHAENLKENTSVNSEDDSAEGNVNARKETDTASEEGSTITDKRNKFKPIQDYFLQLENFAVKDLIKKFNVSRSTIHKALVDAKERGLIADVSRGKYKVNKN